jgi:hypothetical protein
MTYFALFLFVISTLSATAMPPLVRYETNKGTFKGPDRTITWRPWQQSSEVDFRFRIGDRYLGHGEWEHYLGFEELRGAGQSNQAIHDSSGKRERPGGGHDLSRITLRDRESYQRHDDSP